MDKLRDCTTPWDSLPKHQIAFKGGELTLAVDRCGAVSTQTMNPVVGKTRVYHEAKVNTRSVNRRVDGDQSISTRAPTCTEVYHMVYLW